MASLHRCPQCAHVGKVHRSRTRSFWEKLAVYIVPVYSVYRCHNCNWRGWLIRSSASPAKGKLLLAGYILAIVLLLAIVAYLVLANWPDAKFQY